MERISNNMLKRYLANRPASCDEIGNVEVQMILLELLERGEKEDKAVRKYAVQMGTRYLRGGGTWDDLHHADYWTDRCDAEDWVKHFPGSKPVKITITVEG